MNSGQQKVYLGCPYTHENVHVRAHRFKKVSKYAAEIMAQGHLVFSPISHSHQICVEADLPIDFEFWQELDNSFLEWCTVMMVLKLPGWEESKGLEAEIKIAEFMGKEVIYVEYEE